MVRWAFALRGEGEGIAIHHRHYLHSQKLEDTQFPAILIIIRFLTALSVTFW